MDFTDRIKDLYLPDWNERVVGRPGIAVISWYIILTEFIIHLKPNGISNSDQLDHFITV